MITDFMTKPLQGETFLQFPNNILNIKWGEYWVHDKFIYLFYYINTCYIGMNII